MWSGPRNISTALMRSWEARGDTKVCDEPLYAHYLLKTGFAHPGAQEIIADGDTDVARVVTELTEAPLGDYRIYYQKHMGQHLLPGMDTAWVSRLNNAFLIREPREMLTSFIKVMPNADLASTGLPQQVELCEREAQRTGQQPPVIDARDVLENPAGLLAALCESLGVTFLDAMLQWPPGARDSDGVWAKHWYASVEQSTSFGPYQPKPDEVPARYLGLLRDCEALYDKLYEQRLTVPAPTGGDA